MKRIAIMILFVLPFVLLLSACGSSGNGETKTAEDKIDISSMSIEDKFDLFKFMEETTQKNMNLDIRINDKAIQYMVWKDGYADDIDKESGAHKSEIESLAKSAYDRFLEYDFGDLDLGYSLMDDRDPEQGIYVFRNGEFIFDFTEITQARENFKTYEEIDLDNRCNVFMNTYIKEASKYLSEQFGKKYSISKSEKTVEIKTWEDGIFESLEYVGSGYDEFNSSWEGLLKAVEKNAKDYTTLKERIATAAKEVDSEYDYGDLVSVEYSLVSELDKDFDILVFVDGELVFDATEQ